MSDVRRHGIIGVLLRGAAVFAIPGVALMGCDAPPPAAAKAPSTVIVKPARVTQLSSSVSLTGQIAARVQSDLGFRTQGRIASRNVDVGDHVKAGQVLATLETTQQQADVAASTAGVAAAEASLKEAKATFQRQKTLLGQGFTTQPNFDAAKQALDGAQASLTSAKANLGTAQDALANTELHASEAGVVTARGAEVGQVVQVGQSVFTVAEDGPRDAVFDVYESLVTRPPPETGIEIVLQSDPSIRAVGKVREISPSVDTAKGTVRVKIGIDNPPPQMGFGAAVTGIGKFQPRDTVILPWTAFFTEGGRPAVWVVDPQSRKVALKPVEIDTYRTGELILSGGLNDGELVVTHGVQILREGEVVTPQTDATPSPESKR